LVEFRKTNDRRQEVRGVVMYDMEIEADVEIMEDRYWSLKSRVGLDVFTTASEMPDSEIDKVPPKYSMRTRASAGEEQSVTGSMVHEQKEKGWSLRDMSIR